MKKQIEKFLETREVEANAINTTLSVVGTFNHANGNFKVASSVTTTHCDSSPTHLQHMLDAKSAMELKMIEHMQYMRTVWLLQRDGIDGQGDLFGESAESDDSVL